MSGERSLSAQPQENANKKILRLDNVGFLDLEGLPDEKVNELKEMYAKGVLEIALKRGSMLVESEELKNKLEQLTVQAGQAVINGTSATFHADHTTPTGRIDMVIGNTQAAANGGSVLTRIRRFFGGR